MDLKDNWWHPTKLKEFESESKKINSFEQLEKFGDFGSYRRILLGDKFENTMIGKHNSLKPRAKIEFCHKLLNKDKKDIKSVLDLGCGIGITANEINLFYKDAEVAAVDISSDAIEFGKKNFHNINFMCQSIEPEKPKLGSFDIIYAFEFYPFTRTENIDIHRKYLEYLLGQLEPNGDLVIYLQWGDKDSIFSTINTLMNNFSEYDFSLYTAPADKILRIFKIKSLSLMISKLLRIFLLTKQKKIILISKK